MPRRINRGEKFFSLTGHINLEVRRSLGGGDYNDDGIWVPSQKKIVTIRANVQPFNTSQTLLLPEADRTKEWIHVRSPDQIIKMEEGENGTEADVFIYFGKVYKVMALRVYRMGVLDHYHAHAALDSPTPWEKLSG